MCLIEYFVCSVCILEIGEELLHCVNCSDHSFCLSLRDTHVIG